MNEPRPRTANEQRYGVDAPLPETRVLHAGPVSMLLEGGDLRYVKVGNTEIIRRLYIAIRDRNWGTIPPAYTRFDIEDHGSHFRIDLAADHKSDLADFSWSGVITGQADGTISYQMKGSAGTPFLRNRIGFCVLHPSDLAGVPAFTETPDGPVEGSFPQLISPNQPFIDMQSIAHPAGDGLVATISFSGDLFEMEDQRNWTDASYKTYSTPLRLPYPVEVTAEDIVEQSVKLSFSGALPVHAEETDGERLVSIDWSSAKPLPPVGFGAGLRGTIEAGDLERLQALRPDHLWDDIDLGDADWRDRLALAFQRALDIGAPLHLQVVAGAGNSGFEQLATEIAKSSAQVAQLFVFPPVDAKITFPRHDLETHQATVDAAKTAVKAAGLATAVGGGSRAYFTELNRSVPGLPLGDLDSVTFTINPQVHAVDYRSVVETLSAQSAVVESAQVIAAGKPVIVGPVTISPRWNPNATGPTPPAGPNALPGSVDPRQMALFGAGWTVGSLHRLTVAGASGITYYELYGWRGVIERRHDLTKHKLFPSTAGQLFPLYHVFAVLQEFKGGEVADVELSAPFEVETLALRKGDQVAVLVASFVDEPITVELVNSGLTEVTVRKLDESTYDLAIDDPSFFLTGGKPAKDAGETISLQLDPFAVAIVRGKVG